MSAAFGGKTPKRRHLIRGKGGVAGEIDDVRRDIDQAFDYIEALISGSASSFLFPNRVDCSVNCGRVEALYSAAPVLHVQTGGNSAGGFNGAGVGNKGILGFRTGNNLPLGTWTGHQYTYRDLSPLTSLWQPYTNLVVDINGDGSLYKIFVVDPLSNPALNPGTSVTNLDGSKTFTHVAGTHYVLVVNDLAGVVPFVNLGASWVNHGYRIADILAVYPAAKFKEAASGDGGMPASVITPPFMLVVGDSSNNKLHAVRLTNVSFNGVVV